MSKSLQLLNQPISLYRLGSFNALLAYLRLFEGSAESELLKHSVDESAKKCIILAVKVPTVINFEEVLDLDSVKHLKSVWVYIEVLNLISSI